MGKKLIAFCAMSVVIVVSVLLLLPTYLFAPPSPILNPDNGHYYSLIQGNITWQEANDTAESLVYLGMQGYLATITSESEEDFILNNLGLSFWAHYWIGGYQQWESGDGPGDGWCWMTGEKWDYTNWGNNEPNDGDNIENGREDRIELIYVGSSSYWNDERQEYTRFYIVEFGDVELNKIAAPEPVWIRDTEMKCKVVWINADNKFQFSFIYPYANNNWVKIYDMSGKEVYSFDMRYDNPNIIVDLPDGMYTVKTFHDQPEPIQTFVIGKP